MKPTWLRVKPSIRSFILGEVERQYHPIGTSEYAVRVEWMTDAWEWTLVRESKQPTVGDILRIAAMIEPEVNYEGFRKQGVWIKGRAGADYTQVPHLIAGLWTHIGSIKPIQGRTNGLETADDFYLEFEVIHPFGDGNGRTGKILHNWLLGTLEDPVLVTDYFGGGNP